MTLDDLTAAFDSSEIVLPNNFWQDLGKTMAENQSALARISRESQLSEEDWRRVYGGKGFNG